MKALQTGIVNQRWDLAAHALVIGLLKAETVMRHPALPDAGKGHRHPRSPLPGPLPSTVPGEGCNGDD